MRGFTMDFKKIMLEMLDNVKKNEITISTEFNNNSEINFLINTSIHLSYKFFKIKTLFIINK